VSKLNKIYEDYEYMKIVRDILENDKFKKLDGCRHHGLSRLDHSLKVSYYSYCIAKKMKLNYIGVARAGLLHDFFIGEDLDGVRKKLSMFFHPYKSLDNSNNYFDLTEMEKDIIITHMFPTLPHKVPRYLESWLVSGVDKIVATYEFYCSYGLPCIYKLSNLYLFALLFKK
jgi:uncharacterized protein